MRRRGTSGEGRQSARRGIRRQRARRRFQRRAHGVRRVFKAFLKTSLRARHGTPRRIQNAERAEVAEFFPMFLKKLSACSAISAFRSSPPSLVAAPAPRRQRTPRRIQTPSAPRSQSFSGLRRNTLRALGVSIVPAIARPRCSVEEAEALRLNRLRCGRESGQEPVACSLKPG